MERYLTAKRTAAEEEFWEILLRMHAVKGILPMEIRRIDGVEMYCFVRDGKQDLAGFAEGKKLKGSDLRGILAGLRGAMENLEEYLLSPEGILPVPEMILENGEDDWQFCYIPGRPDGQRHSYEDFAAFLSEHIDNEDDEAVELSYGYEEQVARGEINPDRLLQKEQEHLGAMFEVEGFTEASFGEMTLPPPAEEGYYFREEEEKEQETDKKLIRTIGLCIALILLSVAGYLAVFLNPSVLEMIGIRRQNYIAAGAALLAAVTLMILGVIRGYQQQKEREASRKETSSGEYFTELAGSRVR